MKKRVIGIFGFVLGIFFILQNISITGNVISDYIQNFSFQNIIGLAIIFISLFLLIERKSLDAIPTGGGVFDEKEGMYSQDRDRARTALEHGGDLEEKGYFVISGYKGKNKKEISEGQSYSIYKFLRRHGIKPKDMVVEGQSHDTLQNVVYTLKKIKAKEQKEGDKRPWHIAFVSYPRHLERFEDFVEQAEKKGIVNKGDFIFHKIPTGKNSEEEKRYENNPARRLSHLAKLATMERYKQK